MKYINNNITQIEKQWIELTQGEYSWFNDFLEERANLLTDEQFTEAKELLLEIYDLWSTQQRNKDNSKNKILYNIASWAKKNLSLTKWQEHIENLRNPKQIEA